MFTVKRTFFFSVESNLYMCFSAKSLSRYKYILYIYVYII